jgi:hypothetical protein
MSRMSDLDIEMQEMLERGVCIDDVAAHFDVPIEWVWQAYANLLQAYAELWFDDEQYELNA